MVRRRLLTSGWGRQWDAYGHSPQLAELGCLMLSMRALECLVAIVDQGSFTKAAVALHPVAARLVAPDRRYRAGTGHPGHRAVAARNQAPRLGSATATEARIALAAAARAVTVGRKVADGSYGRIRIACAETMTAWVLVPVLRHWRRRFRNVELDLKEYTSANQMLKLLAGGGTDIVVGPPPSRTDEHVEVLGDEEMVIVASTEHRFSKLDAVPLAELAAESVVHYSPGNGHGVWVDQLASERGVILPLPTLRTGSPRTAAQLAAAGMGVAIVPFSALTPRPGGTVRSLDPPALRQVIVIVAAPHDELSRRFVADLKRRGLPASRLSH